MGARADAPDHERSARRVRNAEREDGNALGGAPCRALGWTARVLRQTASRVPDGLELPVRHRTSSRPDHHVPAPDGIQGAADLRSEWRRALAFGVLVVRGPPLLPCGELQRAGAGVFSLLEKTIEDDHRLADRPRFDGSRRGAAYDALDLFTKNLPLPMQHIACPA